MAQTGRDELMDMLVELATLQRANAERLARVERCLSAVTAALPAFAAEGRVDRAQGAAADLGKALTAEERQFLLDEATDALDSDSENNAPPRRFLDS